MDGRDAVRAVELLRPEVAVPVHFEGWSHFSQQEAALRHAVGHALDHPLGKAQPATTTRVTWLRRGVPTKLEDPT